MDNLISKKHLESLIKFRHKLHSEPELSGNEKITSKLIVSRLKKLKNIQIVENVGGYGILAIADSGKSGKTVLFRAEMDALPIQESNDFLYKSKSNTISHKCGHDGHTTVLIGLAELLNKEMPKSGKVVFLFQPSEENGSGAIKVLNDEKFKILKPDFVFAFHNLPGYPLHQIVIKENIFTASVLSLIFKFQGKTSHASEPEKGINPIYILPEMINKILEFENNHPDKDNFFLATPVYIRIGEAAYGTSAAYGEIHYTFRAWDNSLLENRIDIIIQRIKEIAESNKLKMQTEITDRFYNTINDIVACKYIENACTLIDYNFIITNKPFRWGEDFGLFTRHYPGALFCIGSGTDSPPLHSSDYDFPNSIIETGVSLFRLISQLINN